MKLTHLLPLAAVAAVVLTLVVAESPAVQPKRFTHSSEAELLEGEKRDTIVTNLGDVMLARGTEVIGEIPEETSVVYDLQALDGLVYLAAGPEARLMRHTLGGEQLEAVLELDAEQVFALAVLDGELLVGVSGATSRIARLTEDDALETIVELDDVNYVWDMVLDGQTLYLATGTPAALLAVELDADEPAVRTLLETEQANLLSLAMDDASRLYVGTDTDGLIYRVTINEAGEAEPFVLYDAPEPEIAALLVRGDGTVFAGTADAEQARPGRLETPVDEPEGRIDDEVELDEQPAEPEPDQELEPEAEEADDPADEPEPEPDPEPVEADVDLDAPVIEDDEIEDLARLIERGRVVRLDEDGRPTAEQRDALREEIRRRLERARRTGELEAEVAMVVDDEPEIDEDAPEAARPERPVRRPSPARRAQPGNAVYRIDSEGFVTELFRESVMILRLYEDNGRLLIATGNEGELWALAIDRQERAVLTTLEADQIPALTVTADGQILLGTANPAKLVRLDDRFAQEGTYTSDVLDAEQVSLWGTLLMRAEIPAGTSVTVETRSGNVRDPEHAPWTPWQELTVFEHDEAITDLEPRQVGVESPPGRFVQYRLTLRGEGNASPAIGSVELAYLMPNLPPKIESVRAAYPTPRPRRGAAAQQDEEPPSTEMEIEWEASDPNEDQLLYTLEFRPAGARRWLPIADNVDEKSYEWETRRVPDGRYVIRVTASDRLSNPPGMAKTTSRLSDPVLVDNTAPRLEDLDWAGEAGVLRITGVAVDRFSPVASVAYAVNDAEHFTPVLPVDMIFDSTREPFEVTLAGLEPGEHVVTLRVRDTRGNTRYESLIVEVRR